MPYTTTDGHESGYSANRVRRPPTSLRGLREVAEYMGCSEKTALKYIKNEGLPASKVGGVWVSDAAVLDAWRYAALAEK